MGLQRLLLRAVDRGDCLKIITEPKSLIARYISRMQSREVGGQGYEAIGLLNDDEELVAGALFNGYDHPNILMHIACERFTPGFITAIMYFPFVQLKCVRITGVIEEQNVNSRRFAEHLGARQEGVMLRAAPSGDNYCIYGLMAEDAQKWLTKRNLRKLERVAA